MVRTLEKSGKKARLVPVPVMRAGDPIVLMTPDKERGLTGVCITPAHIVKGEAVTSVKLDVHPAVLHYPSEYVARRED